MRLKSYLAGLLTALLVCGLAVTAGAKSGKVMQELTYRDIRVSLDGEVLDLRNAIGDPVEPFMFDGTNYLPVRALAEALGLNVAWNGAEVMVVLTTPDKEETPPEATAPEPEAAPAKEPETSGLNMGQRNALGAAKNYLNVAAFSHDGLIQQLEVSGYDAADAAYAADNCGADWNEQALKKAKNYLNTAAFSYAGLIHQLEYEKFTAEQAAYGANNCGADWNEQAVKKGASYLKLTSFSRDGLIRQLEHDGFTREQAEYGATKNGY